MSSSKESEPTNSHKLPNLLPSSTDDLELADGNSE